MPALLSINLNKIALVRNSREGNYPSVTKFAEFILNENIKGLTVHPRPDQRHIRVSDVYALNDIIKKRGSIEFNIEGNPFAEPMSSALGDYPGLLDIVNAVKPTQVTLVPDNNSQLTSDHGFDLTKDFDRLLPIIDKIHNNGARVSLFMDPDKHQIRLAKDVGAERIELYTGPFAWAYKDKVNSVKTNKLFEQYREASLYAESIGLKVNAGHDLNLDNLPKFLSIGNIQEVSIGHAFTVDALLMGYKTALKAYSEICRSF